MAETDSRSVFPPDTREPRMTQKKILWNVRNFLFIFFFAAYRCGCFACVEMQQKKKNIHDERRSSEGRRKESPLRMCSGWRKRKLSNMLIIGQYMHSESYRRTYCCLAEHRWLAERNSFRQRHAFYYLWIITVIHSQLDWLPLCGDER